MSETIIIESNRQIAYRATIEAEQNASINTPDTATQSEYPSHEWTTYIENGIPIEVGDEISVEASMINVKGSPEETQEFSGGKNKVGNNPLVDNVATIEFQPYIVNRHQFNMNMPKFSSAIDTRYLLPYYGQLAWGDVSLRDIHQNLTGTDVQNFAYFASNYPYQALEGFTIDPTKNPPTSAIIASNLRPSIQNARIDMSIAGPQRLYKCNRFWNGPDLEDEGNAVITNKYLPLNIPEGFNSPATIGEFLTSQFHNRIGNADGWTNSEVNGGTYDIDATTGRIGFHTRATITDETFFTTSTSTGQLFEGRQRNEWGSAFTGEKKVDGSAAVEGTGYVELQGRQMFWNNLLTGETAKLEALSFFQKLKHKPKPSTFFGAGNLNEATTYSGSNYIINNAWGEYGSEVVMLDTHNDVVDTDPLPYSNWKAAGTESQTSLLDDPQLLNLDIGECITTNIPVSYTNLVLLRATFFKNVYQTSSSVEAPFNTGPPVLNPSPTSYYNANLVWNNQRTKFQIGRADDQYSIGQAQKNINLVNPRVATFYTGIPLAAPPVPPLPANLGTLPNGYKVFDWANYGNLPANTPWKDMPRLVQNPIQLAGGNDIKNEYFYAPYEVELFSNMREEFDPSSPNCAIKLPTNSDFSFRNTKGYFYPIKELGIAPPNYDSSNRDYPALAVVFYKEGKAPYESLVDIPFFAVINAFPCGTGNYAGQNKIKIPLPIPGELFGISTSCSDNAWSKIVNVMKTDASQPYIAKSGNTEASPVYPEGTTYQEVAPERYMPYVMIGADNPLITFDSDFSRYTISSLHTATRTGNGIFQLIEVKSNEQFATENLFMQSQEAMISGMSAANQNGIPVVFLDIPQQEFPSPTISAQSGIGITNMYIPTLSAMNNFYLDRIGDALIADTIKMDVLTPNQYKGTLFDKLGFDIEQLIGMFGVQNAQFNQYNVVKYIGYPQSALLKQRNTPLPMTTNAYVSASVMLAVSQNIAQYPMENIAGVRPNQLEANAESDKLIARNLPSKLDYSYLVVYSDIIPNVKYYGGANGEQKIPAMAYISRNYSTGDFFYSFTTDWTYMVDKPYILSHFKVDIRLPNGKPAPISDNSSLIFKVMKRKVMPPIQNPTMSPEEQKKIDDANKKKNPDKN
jgi:hypothetical protein